METHEMVGKKVRSTIKDIGGILPENIPTAEPIKKVEKRLKTARPRLAVDPKVTWATAYAWNLKEMAFFIKWCAISPELFSISQQKRSLLMISLKSS